MADRLLLVVLDLIDNAVDFGRAVERRKRLIRGSVHERRELTRADESSRRMTLAVNAILALCHSPANDDPGLRPRDLRQCQRQAGSSGRCIDRIDVSNPPPDETPTIRLR